MAFLRWWIGLVCAVIIAGFVVMNRHDTALFYSPIHPAIETPVMFIALGAFAFGFLLGAVIVWLGSLNDKFEKRKQRKEIAGLKKSLHEAGKNAGELKTPQNDLFPALTHKTSAHKKGP